MTFALLLSSLVSGIIATAVMLAALYFLPRLWGGAPYDVLGALGSAVTKELDSGARLLGSALYFAGGVVFAIFYGWIALLLLNAPEGTQIPVYALSVGEPNGINFLYPLLGMHIGFAHGLIVFLFNAIIVLEHHPIEKFRTRYSFVGAQIFSHIIYGAVVMFAHHQFLQLFLGR